MSAADRTCLQDTGQAVSELGIPRQDSREEPTLFSFLPWRVEKRGLDVSSVISDAEGCDQARIFDRDVGEAIVRAVNGYETALGLLREATLVSSDGWDALDARMRKFLEAELGY